MEEAIRKLEKMIENPSRADKIVYTRGDIEDAIEGINRLKDRIKKLEQENKNLKLTLEQMENTCKDYLNDRDTLREDNRKLKENGLLGQATMEEAYNRIKELEERIRFLEQCLDNKEKVNKSMRNEIRNLKKELGKITVHSNMLESENILLKKECKARLDKIEELEKEIEELNKMMLFETELEK